jgi:hypothetical protein
MKHITVLASVVLLALVLMTGCTTGDEAPTGVPTPIVLRPSGTADSLTLLQQRPLHLPTLAPGAACPALPGKQVSPDLGSALGVGPIYMVGYGAQGIISFYGFREDGGWYYLKTIWTAPPDFQGLFLLRGHQLDGPNEVRFSEGFAGTPDLQASFSSDNAGSTPSGWQPWINYVRVRAPGCYAVQVDGLHFSEVITFQAVNTPQQ